MYNRRIILISIILILIFIITLIIAELPKTKKISIKGENGQMIAINNIFKNNVSSNGAILFLAQNSDYSIYYYMSFNTFYIEIKNQEFSYYRKEAETKLLKLLSINQEDACKLPINLSIPYDYQDPKSKINYGLSFCPNAKNF